MTTQARTFATGIEASLAILPGAPGFWSYSSLKEVETCPRRYALSRASYPNLWEQRGYPPAPTAAALFGDVVHGAIELILKALTSAGCTSPKSAETVIVLRSLGGYTAVAEKILARRLAKLEGNPRVRSEQRQRLERELRDRLPDARSEIQGFLSRITLLPRDVSVDPSHSSLGQDQKPPGRREITDGAYPEMDLMADSLRLAGRVDLLTLAEGGAQITDFKTGTEDPSHREQLFTYALLWERDQVVNPRRTSCCDLRVVYPNREVVVVPPDDAGLAQLESSLVERIRAADQAVEAPSPAARLNDACGLCGVRPLCADYWANNSTAPVPSIDGAWFDLEGTVLRQHGAKSWVLQLAGGRGQILVRTASPSETLPIGRSLRLLGVRRVANPEEPEAVIAALGGRSETFMLAET